MKKFTQLVESCLTADVNQGNGLELGVTNHYTPIDNIVTNVRNIFCMLPIFVAVAEDGVSIKIHSTKFVSEADVDAILNMQVARTCLLTYLQQQGLDKVVKQNIGQYFVVFCSPSDVKGAFPCWETDKKETPDTGTKEGTVVTATKEEVKKAVNDVKKMNVKESLEDELELVTEGNADEDEELEDLTKAKLKEIVTSSDKVKAAKQLSILVAQEMELPNEYYFAGVTDKAKKDQSIALRWRYTKRGGHDTTVEMVKSLLNIYDVTDKGVFVPDFDKDSMFHLPDEVKKLIENILEFIGAEKTNDECIYSLTSLDKDAPKNDDEKKDDNKSDEGGEKKDDNKSDEGGEKKDDNKSEGDDLLG